MNTDNHLVTASLRLDPVPGLDRVRDELTWHVAVDAEPAEPLLAGVARLRPAGSNLVAVFDYTNPSRLLACDIPFGIIDDDESIEDVDDRLVQLGWLTDLDAALVRLLLGDGVVDRLRSGTEFSAGVDAAVAGRWETLGRIAIVQTMLARRSIRLDGLWAAEVASLLWGLHTDGAIGEWARHLVDLSGPALRLLDERWLERTVDPPLGELERVLAACRRVAPDADLGPLAETLRARADQGLLDELQRTVRRAHEEVMADAGEDLAARLQDLLGARTMLGSEVVLGGAPSARIVLGGATRSTSAPRSSPALRDHSLPLRAETQATWRVEDGKLVVRVQPPSALPLSHAQRTMVRATAGGALVAASVSMGVDPDSGELVARLTLPPWVDPNALTVVVGRHLPVAPFDVEGFDRRQAVHLSQEATDALRSSSDDAEWAADRATLAWNRLGVDAKPALDRPQRPFLVERLRRSIRSRIVVELDEPASPEQRSGARSLAQALGRPAEAGEHELARLAGGGNPLELTVRQVDALIAAAAEAGRDRVARGLSEHADELVVAEL